jgi:hypothetical protein
MSPEKLKSQRKGSGSAQFGGRYAVVQHSLADVESPVLAGLKVGGKEAGLNMKTSVAGPFFGSLDIERGSRSVQLGLE